MYLNLLWIAVRLRKLYSLIKMVGFVLKKKCYSLKMNNITVVELKALAKEQGMKGYYKLRNAELIQKVETHPDVNEQVLIPGLEIPRNNKISEHQNNS